MSYCAILGKKKMRGNNVSHANNKTKRDFLGNIHVLTTKNPLIGKFRLKVSAHGMRTIEKKGGIINFLITSKKRNLTEECQRYKKRIIKSMEKAEQKASASTSS
ncbi:50S ribosomal protein L28 [Candidatus Nesciobacter abundans]